MDPENTETNTTNDTPTGDTSQSVDVTATPEFKAAVEAEAKRVHDAAYAKARREFEARSKEQPKSKAAETITAPPAVTGDRAFEDSLADSLSEQKSLTKDQRQLVRKLARMEKPDDVDSYVARMAATFGPAPAAAAGNTTNTNNAAKSVASTPPAPISTVPGDGPESIRKYDESMIRNYLGKNGGGNPANPMHWSNRKASIEIAKRLEAELAGIRIVASKG